MSEIIDSLFITNPVLHVVVDVETTMNGPDRSPDPFHPSNKALIGGYQTPNKDSCPFIFDIPEFVNALNSLEPFVMVGHNVKFDLHYLRKHGLNIDKILGVLDTQVMTYNLSDNELKFPTLNEALEFVGLPDRKDDTVEKLWAQGLTNEQIDPETLKKYLLQDIAITTKLFLALRKKMGLIGPPAKLNQLMARSTEAIEEIEWNGMYVDVSATHQKIEDLEKELGGLLVGIELWSAIALGGSYNVNATSNTTVSTMVFGYPGVTVEETIPNGTYKNGKPKTKKVKNKLYPMVPPTKSLMPIDITAIHPVDEEALLMAKNGATAMIQQYIDDLLRWRDLNKQLNTYYQPFINMVTEYNAPYIHPAIHQTATSTGRTASSKPNGQNIPGDVRKVLVSRYPGGSIMSADFNQLEVCGIAQLSKDPVLIADLTGGTDIHTVANGGTRGTPEVRRNVKGVVFGTFYGGGVKKLAAQTGLPESRVKEIQNNLKKQYPDAMAYNHVVKKELDASKQYTTKVEDGFAVGRGTFGLPTGRSLSFYTKLQARKGWGGKPDTTQMEWPHSQCCDRPAQGLSTGDLSQAYLGLVHHFMKHFDSEGWFKDVKIIMFAHDELVFDVPPEAPQGELVAALTVLAESVLPVLYERWTGEPWLVPLKLNVNFNNHWSK